MIDTQYLYDALMTVAFLVGLVIAISAWIATAGALHQRDERRAHIRAIEQHLADAAEQSPVRGR